MTGMACAWPAAAVTVPTMAISPGCPAAQTPEGVWAIVFSSAASA